MRNCTYHTAAILVLSCGFAFAQPDSAKREFEVASITSSGIAPEGAIYYSSPAGGPGTSDPSTLRWERCSIGVLLERAFQFKPSQYDWNPQLFTHLFVIKAKVPPGTTKEDMPFMLQTLLKDRFHLVYHFDKKDVQGYQLVTAKGGPKLKESVTTLPETAPIQATAVGKDGFPDRDGFSGIMGALGYKIRVRRETMQQFATDLAKWGAGGPVQDATGLAGMYDITLYWGPNSRTAPDPLTAPAALPQDGPTLTTALQSQLGLKLEARKIAIDVFVIDHIDKIPTEN
jgi:uncharacterized protein (TIGR03435 family)